MTCCHPLHSSQSLECKKNLLKGVMLSNRMQSVATWRQKWPVEDQNKPHKVGERLGRGLKSVCGQLKGDRGAPLSHEATQSPKTHKPQAFIIFYEKVGQYPKIGDFKKMEIQFLSAENNSMWTSFGKKLSHSIGDHKNVKTGPQWMSLTEKTEFHFFPCPYFRVLPKVVPGRSPWVLSPSSESLGPSFLYQQTTKTLPSNEDKVKPKK